MLELQQNLCHASSCYFHSSQDRIQIPWYRYYTNIEYYVNQKSIQDLPHYLGKEWIGGIFQQACKGRRPEPFETDSVLLRTSEGAKHHEGVGENLSASVRPRRIRRVKGGWEKCYNANSFGFREALTVIFRVVILGKNEKANPLRFRWDDKP